MNSVDTVLEVCGSADDNEAATKPITARRSAAPSSVRATAGLLLHAGGAYGLYSQTPERATPPAARTHVADVPQ